MTVRNGLPLVRRAISSIEGQTSENWEAVVVDDGSTDGTADYLRELSRADDRFRIVLTGGVGRGRALNLALEAASGRYVANLDADDVAHPDRARAQVEWLESTGGDFVSGRRLLIRGHARAAWEPLPSVDRPSAVDVTEDLMRGNPISHTTVAMKRDVVLSLGGYDEARRSQYDYDLWCRLARAGLRLRTLSLCLAAKRIHARQSFERRKRIRYLLSSCALQNRAISDLGGGLGERAHSVARFGYGLMPQPLRMRRVRWRIGSIGPEGGGRA